MSYKEHFSKSLRRGRLHFAAHSHHPWPDVSFEAHQQAWQDAANLLDDKWDHVFGEVVPAAQRHVARILGLTDADAVVFAPNTHELVARVASCLEAPFSLLTTDGEYHSLSRQARRWEEAGVAKVDRISVEPFDTFPDRFGEAAAAGRHDLIYLSHVFFNSGYVVPHLEGIVGAVPSPESFLIIDGYHSFMALPVDFAALASRAFFTAGGYKYAAAGEGACFLVCPPRYGPRPVDTGWFAAFAALTTSSNEVDYAESGARFWGATFDPTGLYRFNAAQELWLEIGLDVSSIHEHVRVLQNRFMAGLGSRRGPLARSELVPRWDDTDRGHFLTFCLPGAESAYRQLHRRGVITDFRADRLRIGFGIYHDPDDVDQLLETLDEM